MKNFFCNMMILDYLLLQMYTSKADGSDRNQRVEQDNGKLLLLCQVTILQKSTPLCKVPWLRPFVLLVAVTGRWRGVWIIDGKILTAKQANLSEKNLFRCRFVHRRAPCVGRRHNPRLHRHRSASNRLSHGKDSIYVIYIYTHTHTSIPTSQKT